MALAGTIASQLPQFQLSNLPNYQDYDTLQAYTDALNAAHAADPENSGNLYAAPGSFTSPDGQQFTSAGFNDKNHPFGGSAAGLGAENYNSIIQRMASDPHLASFNLMALQSRMALHPEEAQAAYDAYSVDPTTGLPQAELDPLAAALMENAGMRPPTAAATGDGRTADGQHSKRGPDAPQRPAPGTITNTDHNARGVGPQRPAPGQANDLYPQWLLDYHNSVMQQPPATPGKPLDSYGPMPLKVQGY